MNLLGGLSLAGVRSRQRGKEKGSRLQTTLGTHNGAMHTLPSSQVITGHLMSIYEVLEISSGDRFRKLA